jgi:hypothetical protein
MYKKIVIGIDQSYTRTGISIAGDGKLLKVGYIPFEPSECHSEKRKKVKDKLTQIIKLNKHKASQMVIIVERIRQFSGGNLSMDYIKSTGALIGCIVDTAAEYGVSVFSADTRSWKSQVVGTSVPRANKYNVDPKKWPTIEYLLSRNDVVQDDLLVEVGKRSKKFAYCIEGTKYCFNDDAADSACIALYGFAKGRSLKREE